MQALKPLFFAALHQLGNQIRGRIEANASALGTSGKSQGADQMCFAGSRISDEKHVFSFVQVLPSQKLSNQLQGRLKRLNPDNLLLYILE